MSTEEKILTGHLPQRVDELRARLKSVPDLHVLAIKSGVDYIASIGELRFKLFDQPVFLSHPEYVAGNSQTKENLPVHIQALLFYYLLTSDGSSLENQWISFAELPNGRFYESAFQGYTGRVLTQKFSNDVREFSNVARRCAGAPILLGDAGFVFTALPRIPLAVVYHLGDEDFPSTCKILFDRSISHYLPTDVCAILGSMLTHRMVNLL